MTSSTSGPGSLIPTERRPRGFFGPFSRLALTIASAALASPAVGQTYTVDQVGTGGFLYPKQDMKALAAKIADACASEGMNPLSYDDHSATCTYDGSSVLLLLIRPKYSTTPAGVARFTLFERPDAIAVRVDDSVSSQNAFGQTQTYSGDMGDEIIDLVLRTGGSLSPGAKAHGVDLGTFGKLGGAKGVGVTYVVEDFAANSDGHEAGLIAGDQIGRINGKSFGTLYDFRRKLEKYGRLGPLQLSVWRDGQRMEFTVSPRFVDAAHS